MSPTFRWTELSLLLAPSSLVLVGVLLLSTTPDGSLSLESLTPAILFLGAVLTTHLLLSLKGFRGDQILFPLMVGLSGIGLVLIQRLAGTQLALRQVLWFVLSLLTLAGILLFLRGVSLLQRYKYTWALLGFFLVAVTFFLGRGSSLSGPRLWLDLGLFRFQPSEVLKILLVIFFAGYLEQYREILTLGVYRVGGLSLPPLPHLVPLLLMWGLTLALLVVQKDLGAALLFFGIFLAMLYLASGRLLYVVLGLAGFLLAAAIAYAHVEVVQQRVSIWLNPWQDPSGSAYQAIQGLIALASGGLLGVGLGYGSPGYIPAVHTDFLLAALGEEMGFLGGLGVLALYILLSYRGYRIALGGRSGFHQLLASGLTTIIALQSLVIMGGNLRLIPLTGITLPFLSYGGSSLLTNFIIVALLLKVSEEASIG